MGDEGDRGARQHGRAVLLGAGAVSVAVADTRAQGRHVFPFR